ncbi:MAG: transglutaminase protein [Candidatus Magnetoglobus multicellularis str. Araruama]|uniref:Transglutaminase protein n=1 Tax=Candidatus Magnetoglobus multicellularis str. Araruama TaxID=890399 RepID=A0A1V1PEQ7_9BACT|nr:MAG: transglutaminase protein [Candidatus Magnetoglobus multicellularis str. Araruama]
MKYKLTHKTIYAYSEQAALSQNELCLFPRNTNQQTCIDSKIRINPKPSILDHTVDYFGNNIHNFMVKYPHDTLDITSESVVETNDAPLIDAASTLYWESARDIIHAHQTLEDLDAYQYIFPSDFIHFNPEITEYARVSFYPNRPILEAALDLTERIFNEFTYDKNATKIGTPIMDVLKNKKGVCQDFAHLQIASLRLLGLAARYVSGYIETLPPPGEQKLIGADASHAWLSIYIPGIGWIDLDPTNNQIPGQQYVTVAWGRDYGDVTPVKGLIWGGGFHKLTVNVDLLSIH